MLDLLPRTTYYYKVGGISALSKIYSFNTGRIRGDSTSPLAIAIVGDLGTSSDSQRTLDAMMNTMKTDPNLDFSIIVGDLAYADGKYSTILYYVVVAC